MNLSEELVNTQRELSAIVDQIEHIRTLDGEEWSREVEQFCAELEQTENRVRKTIRILKQQKEPQP